MIRAKIVQISSKDGVSFFELECLNLGTNLYMLALNEASKFALNDEVSLNFKSSDVILSKLRLEASSLENELKCEVTDVTRGEILSIISLKCEQLCFEAIISDHALKGLNLAVGEQVFAYVKSTSIHVSA
ncbi:TOBE domain-containing protein [Campylobacter concisus]|uniref:TOBE domain-containing protein n=1 Tax=Campylobacter concisus TaxID=199 RepID=UPI001883C1BB|nr:TOBE domain-containing protein [Campylobacter concisus]MBE9869884.1 TOBE domain-containing protein [Campylobacter concisus]